MVVPICTPPSAVRELPLLRALQDLGLTVFNASHLVNVWFLTVALTFILPMTPECELHFMFLLDIKTLVKCPFKSFIHFSIGFLIDLRSYPENNYLPGVNIATLVPPPPPTGIAFSCLKSLEVSPTLRS